MVKESKRDWTNERHSQMFVTSRMRLRDHDYTSPGRYFVTTGTQHRSCLFGDVVEGQMVLNPAGVVIDSWWTSLQWRYPHVTCDRFVIMPNHLHGIVIVGVSSPQPDRVPSLSDIIGWFKNRTAIDYGLGVRTLDWQPYEGKLWQPGFHEHIIRSDTALHRIRAYIDANPAQWDEDEENPRNADPADPAT